MAVPSGIWHEFVIAGHACKGIVGWYIGGVRIPTASAEGDPETTAYFLVPGYSAWTTAFGGATTRTYNGRVYTVVYILEGKHSPIDIETVRNGEKPLTVNVLGIDDVGDSSGGLLTASFDIYKHAMRNWVFGDYQSGAWLALETFPDSTPVMDESSFDACQTISEGRIAGGYAGAGVAGYEGFLGIADFIKQLNISWDCDSGLNRKCQFFVSMVDDAAINSAISPRLTELDILKGTLDVSDDFSNHFNVVPIRYQRRHVADNAVPWQVVEDVRSEESIENYLFELIMGEQEMFFTRDADTANDVGYRKLMRHKDPPRLVRFSLAATGLNIELGEVRSVTHFGGIGSNGWSDQPVRVHKHATLAGQMRTDFEGYDLSRLFLGVFVLGNESALPASWASASAAERAYGYLADETTGEFSDGSPAKRLR